MAKQDYDELLCLLGRNCYRLDHQRYENPELNRWVTLVHSQEYLTVVVGFIDDSRPERTCFMLENNRYSGFTVNWLGEQPMQYLNCCDRRRWMKQLVDLITNKKNISCSGKTKIMAETASLVPGTGGTAVASSKLPFEIPKNRLLIIGTALFVIASAISASLGAYFNHISDYKNAQASGIFAAIFAIATLILFVWLQFSESNALSTTYNKYSQAYRQANLGWQAGKLGKVITGAV